jgi:hypothetical protein
MPSTTVYPLKISSVIELHGKWQCLSTCDNVRNVHGAIACYHVTRPEGVSCRILLEFVAHENHD